MLSWSSLAEGEFRHDRQGLIGLRKRFVWVAGLSLLVLGWWPLHAHADLITDLVATVSPQPGGLTLYQYTLTDESGEHSAYCGVHAERLDRC